MGNYVIRGGGEGLDRLTLLSRVLAPGTRAFLTRAGLAPGLRALDLGCGGGHVAALMADRVGPAGRVLGLDRDAALLRLARRAPWCAGRANLELKAGDASALARDGEFDFAFARFLLSHLPDPAAVLARMTRAVRPGGRVAVEDVDFQGHVWHPPCPALDRYVQLYREVVRRRGGDADLGPKLPALFLAAGLTAVRARAVQPLWLRGEGKRLAEVTLRLIAGPVREERLASEGELEALAAEVAAYAGRDDTLLSLPRLFQVHARRPAGGAGGARHGPH